MSEGVNETICHGDWVGVRQGGDGGGVIDGVIERTESDQS